MAKHIAKVLRVFTFNTWYLLLVIVIAPWRVLALEPLPDEIVRRGLYCISLVYAQEFPIAMEEAKRLAKRFPDHPAGSFFQAVVLDSWMTFNESSDKESEFYQECEKTVVKGGLLSQREPQNAWAQFFVGGAEGLKGSFETRYERWITAFRYGWRGVAILKALQQTYKEMVDADYGIGTYEYWRSAKTKDMFWLPGVEDQRSSGIRRLYASMQNGLFTKTSSAVNLLPILWEEKRYTEMGSIAEEMLELYPDNRIFKWGKAQAALGREQYAEAQEGFRGILADLEKDVGNGYNAVLCHYWLARIARAAGNGAECAAECDRMNNYKLSNDTRKRLERFFTDAAILKRGGALVK